MFLSQVDEWESDPADVDLYDRDDVDWDGQYSSGRKRRSDRDGVVVDVDSFTRRLRKHRTETHEEINQRMLSVELAVKEALLARGESQFTDQEFPPNDRSLFVDPDNPLLKLQATSLSLSLMRSFFFLSLSLLNYQTLFFRLCLSG